MMSSFDWVNVHMPCPTCGTEISRFQSKGGPRRQLTIDPSEVHEFHEYCWKCGTWISFRCTTCDKPTFRPEPFSRSEVESLGFVLQTELAP